VVLRAIVLSTFIPVQAIVYTRAAQMYSHCDSINRNPEKLSVAVGENERRRRGRNKEKTGKLSDHARLGTLEVIRYRQFHQVVTSTLASGGYCCISQIPVGNRRAQ
jgi:hypothetical protein